MVATTPTTETTVATKKTVARKKAPSTTHIVFVVDASGSMYGKEKDVIGGFNQYIASLREQNQAQTRYSISFVKFNTEYKVVFSAVPLEKVQALDSLTYHVGGGTALYDALGTAIVATTHAIKHTKKKPYGSESVIVIVMTDGEENSSKEYSHDAIHGKITRRQDAGNWTFVYLGAGIDAWSTARSFGIHAGNYATYDANSTRRTFDNLTASSTAFTQSGTASSTTFAGSVQDANPDLNKKP